MTASGGANAVETERGGTAQAMEETMTEDQLHKMPWTRHLMTNEELRQWLASRSKAGCQINAETCEIGGWYVNEVDEYGISANFWANCTQRRSEFQLITVFSFARPEQRLGVGE